MDTRPFHAISPCKKTTNCGKKAQKTAWISNPHSVLKQKSKTKRDNFCYHLFQSYMLTHTYDVQCVPEKIAIGY